ncbi:MAG: D-sedoheptulose 7-phosphate isomerase [Thermodesulfobacteriota bacterium]|nr:D-sedoheptulose 7-phosphate isomerase [Thermodesulfobacteriota bacterium]
MRQSILESLETSISVKQNFIRNNLDLIEKGAKCLADTFKKGNKVLIFGNGGSAADAQHLAAEFINRFQMERPPLAALALTVDTSVLTSIGNDYSFDDIFQKQIQGLGRKDDLALGISTSGNSLNVIQGLRSAKSMGLRTMGFSGTRGKVKDMVDFAYCVDSSSTARIQESHILLAHILCDLTERSLFNE